jgi:hypothetical protein
MFRHRRPAANAIVGKRGTGTAVSSGLQLLRDARDLVASGWCQRADARDVRGDEVDAWDDDAAVWSLLGSIVAVLERKAATTGEIPLDELSAALYALAGVIETDSLVAWNDAPSRSQREVLHVLDAASAAYEAPAPLYASAN